MTAAIHISKHVADKLGLESAALNISTGRVSSLRYSKTVW